MYSAGQRIQLKNGEDISRLLPAAYLRDRRDNRHDALPDGFDLDVVPQLQVSPAEMPESNQRAPVFSRGGQTLLNTISGIWSFNASTRLLSISEVAIVGAPGPVSLTLSGGTSPAGVPLQAATLHAHLALGKVSTDKLGVDHWPTGGCCICVLVHVLSYVDCHPPSICILRNPATALSKQLRTCTANISHLHIQSVELSDTSLKDIASQDGCGLQALKVALLSALLLTLGPLTRLDYADHAPLLPTGPVSLCYQVQSLLVTLQDAGGNTVPLPSVSLFVIIDPLPGSTATLTAYECGSQQLAVTKAGTQLKVAPFLITSQTAGQAKTHSGNAYNDGCSICLRLC